MILRCGVTAGLKISWKDKVTNKDILRINQTEFAFHERQEKMRRTCTERLECFIRSKDIRGKKRWMEKRK